MCRNFRKAFTLIELLVVISIIALLMSIMMPGLQKAKRQASLTVCGSNVHSYTVGLEMAALSNNGKYIKRPTVMPLRIEYGLKTDEEKRNLLDNLYAAFGESDPKAFNCPFAPESWYPDGVTAGPFDDPDKLTYGKVWRVASNGYWSATYSLYAGMDSPLLDWKKSGNSRTDKGPTTSTNSRDVIVADRTESLTLTTPRWNHGHLPGKKGGDGFAAGIPRVDAPYPDEFYESNRGYGDGHLEKVKSKEHLRWVSYNKGNFYLY